MNNLGLRWRRSLNWYLRRLLFKSPPSRLSAERLSLWLKLLEQTKDVPGDVVEIGIYLGGTMALASRAMRRFGNDKTYVGVDTFSGFVETQFDEDVVQGNTQRNRFVAADSTEQLARWVVGTYGGGKTELLRGDIASVNLGERRTVSAALIDCDLAVPTYFALNRLYPMLAPSGIILIDDCDERYLWQARKGVERFAQENKVSPVPCRGMMIVTHPGAS